MASHGHGKDIIHQETFPINEMNEFLEDMNCKKFVDGLLETLAKDPLFQVSEKELTGQMPLEDYRHLTHLRAKKWLQYNFLTAEMMMENPMLSAYVQTICGMFGFGWSVLARFGLNAGVCPVKMAF